MTPDERIKYLKDFEYAEKHGESKKGGFLDRLIAKGNKKTEDEIAQERKLREAVQHGKENQAQASHTQV